MSLPKIAEAFAKAATTYDAHAEVQILAADRLAAYMEANTRDLIDGAILEIGCGTGLFSQRMLEMFSNRHIFITDISQQMLNQCKERISKSRITTHNNNLLFQLHDADEPFAEPAQLSMIAAAFALQWMTDLQTSLAALTSKLPSKGTLFFSVPSEASFPEWKELCKRTGVPCTANELPTIQQLRDFAKNNPVRLSLYEESIKIQYRSLHEFLQSLKFVGAHINKHNPDADGTLSVSQLRRLLHESELIHPNSFSVTYNILFGHLTRI